MGVAAYLYTAKGHDSSVALTPRLIKDMRQDQILWIDLQGGRQRDWTELANVIDIHVDMIKKLISPDQSYKLNNYGSFFTFAVSTIVRSAVDGRSSYQALPLGFIVSARWIVTLHEKPIEFLKAFRAKDKGETAIGTLTPPSLVAALLDWHLAEYFREVACIEADTDAIDQHILAEGAQRTILKDIVAIQSRVSSLRALIASERPIFHGLTRPDFALILTQDATEQFTVLSARFDRAVDEIERSRDVALGSFNLFTSMTNLDTNDLVKILSFITVIIGACAAVAGLLGMNFKLAFFDTGLFGFSLVSIGLGLIALVATWWAKRHGWIA